MSVLVGEIAIGQMMPIFILFSLGIGMILAWMWWEDNSNN